MSLRLSLAAAALLLGGCYGGRDDALVVYCAHDAEYSEPVLREFERRTGIPVRVRFDTEAAKSLGLVNLIVREAAAPRCDVFWNNETLGAMDLAERGLLEPYEGSGYDRIPDRYKDPDGRWCGFAGRLRVWIVNADAMMADPEAVASAFDANLAGFTWAKPIYGTTLTHYCLLRSRLGADGFRAFDERLRATATQAASNGQTRDLVAAGTCDFGWTDTDDYFAAAAAGKPVAMVPVTVDAEGRHTPDGETICIPNAVGIVKGTKRRDAAEKLVDYLLSEEVERRLAESPARQVPLGPVAEADLPEDVRRLKPFADRGADLAPAFAVRAETLERLTATYTR